MRKKKNICVKLEKKKNIRKNKNAPRNTAVKFCNTATQAAVPH